MPKNADIFLCEICDFNCCKKSNYDIHILTSKHIKANNANNSNISNDVSTSSRSNTTSSSTSETLRRHVNHPYQQQRQQQQQIQSDDDQLKQANNDSEINDKTIGDTNEDECKSASSSPRSSAVKRDESAGAGVKKEKKKVSFNDSLLQVHLIPNISYNSLSIEKFKYQLKTTTITMENNDIDEENDLIGYDDYSVLNTNSAAAISSSNPYAAANYRLSRQSDSAVTSAYPSSYYDHTPIRERDSAKQTNINFYNNNNNNSTGNETSASSKTSFLLSSSLISSYHNASTVNNNNNNNNSESNVNSSNSSNNPYQYTAAPQVHELSKAFMPNSKLYRTTIFKSFQETNDMKSGDQSRRINSANRESPGLNRNNSAKSDNQTEMNNNSNNNSRSGTEQQQQQISSASYLNKFAAKKRESPTATSITNRIGSSTSSASSFSINSRGAS